VVVVVVSLEVVVVVVVVVVSLEVVVVVVVVVVSLEVVVVVVVVVVSLEVVVVVVVVVVSLEVVVVVVVVVVVDVHWGNVTIHTHSFPMALLVHDGIVPGRGSHEALAPSGSGIGPAESVHSLPSFSKNFRVSPPRPSWHCS